MSYQEQQDAYRRAEAKAAGRLIRNVVLGASGAAILLFGGCSVIGHSTTVEPGNVGVRIKTLGSGAGVSPEALPARWYYRGIGERIVQYPVIQRTYTYTRESDERGKENEEITFSDNNALPMTADVQLVMQVTPSMAPQLYTKWRLTFDQLFEVPIRNDVRTYIAEETEKQPVDYLFKGGRQEVIQKALKRLQAKWAPQGVQITQLDWIGNIRYPDVILNSIQATTKANTDRVAAEAQVAVATARAEAKIAEARGQAESNRLLAESIRTGPEVVQLRAIEKWNGQLPTATGGAAVPFIKMN